ncbi:hypothetical protein M5689_014309 [Euphorbia peplus]|nr:hypothetical protein M5689_014309 [Euphorbia peplus]
MEPPSFSLGLDLDLDLYPAPPTTSPTLSFHEDDNRGHPYEVMDSDPESGPDSPRVFKRLRRGSESGPTKREMEKGSFDNCNDDIEEFSSQEDDFIIGDKRPSTYNSICSSSKVPLCGHGVLTNQSSTQLKDKNTGSTSDAPSSSCLGTGQNGIIFPKLTVSPLRRFQLVDSDTEESSPERKIPGSDSSLKKKQPSAILPKRNLSEQKHQSEDLWKDFSPMKTFKISTPALDEVCEEYFQSVRDKNTSGTLGSHLHKEGRVVYEHDANTIPRAKQSWNSADPDPPAHCYFFHDDPRIQRLVRSRLPHFIPLGIAKNRETQQPSELVINYMSQFNGEASKQRTTQKKTNEPGSSRGRGKSRKSNAKEAQSSSGWVDPKISATNPKDAGKRRVQANGHGGGRWYTSPEGKKVYVSKGRQELSGRMAYTQYKKNNGGFKKSRKKTNAKRKKG